MSETAFRALFKRVMGSTPHRYIEEQRIQHASHLLIHTNSTITQIALTVGYNDLYHFSRVFKRVMGVPPSQFRERLIT
jgi:AraC-like DNA-binding protein